MKTKEIIELGQKLGLPFNPETNFDDSLEKKYVVFDGVNGQRFEIDGNEMGDDEILGRMGDALKLMGRRQLKLELRTLLNITSDN